MIIAPRPLRAKMFYDVWILKRYSLISIYSNEYTKFSHKAIELVGRGKVHGAN